MWPYLTCAPPPPLIHLIPPNNSSNIERQWELEMVALEQERLKAMEQEQKQDDPETDIILQNLDSELKSLIQV